MSLLLASAFLAWKDEHRNTATVIAEKSQLSSQLGQCGANLSSLSASLRDKESLATSFQTAFTSMQVPQAQQAANIASCINTLARMNPKLHQEIKAFPLQYAVRDANSNRFVSPQFTNKVYLSEMLITVNQIGLRPFGKIHCDAPFTMENYPTLPVIPPHSFNEQVTIPPKETKTEYLINVVNTGAQWGPSTPIYFPISSQSESVGNCTFTLIE